MRARSPQPRRIGAALLVAVWLLVPLLALVHGSHAHRYCPEHGTFEEVASSGDEGGAFRESTVVAPGAPRLADAGAATVADGHEDCPLLGAQQRQVIPGPIAVLLPEGLAPAELRGSRTPVVEPQVALLTIAPKGSPPRA
ncbi:hypothetical protein HPC49_23140 [Pyxidicoccus fallax]|uniref:Uncharacterized protein n=1 Tax=Pyxidicoccus fallax TaxID=394095 RepID=A0A848LRM5_9BACT|nr:hypothetical protein [Pyxidicoccus fallax]NMO20341.1 hypothetical protein [Pyxidicoccus fallax]NPC81109.1 hypothetical protein [Pyxidicoccus fallax]